MTKRVTDKAALEAGRRADFRCVTTHLEHGRCAGARVEIDHRKPRGQMGSHSPENLDLRCPDCHRRKHGENLPPLNGIPRRHFDGPFTDDQGRTYWTADMGGETEVRKERFYIWDEVKDELYPVALELHDKLASLVHRAEITRIQMAYVLGKMEARAAFELLGFEDGDHYLQEMGVASPPTRRAYLNAGRFLVENEDVYVLIEKFNERREAADDFPWSLLKGSVGTLRRLPPDRRKEKVVEMMAQRMDGVHVESIVSELREAFPRNQRAWHVTGRLVEGSFDATVEAPDAKKAVERAEAMIRSAARCGVYVDYSPTWFTVTRKEKP
jgi:hypothetical protein